MLTNSERAVFAGIEITRNGIRYRFHNRQAALKQLAIRLGFYTPVVDQGANSIAHMIQELQSAGQMQRLPLRRER